MKAVILAATPGTLRFPLANCYTKLTFPLANKPLICYVLETLQQNDIYNVAIVLSPRQRQYQPQITDCIKQEVTKVQVSFFEEQSPRGTAGALKDLQPFLGTSHFFVFSTGLFIRDLPLSDIIAFHTVHKARATVVVEQNERQTADGEHIEISEGGRVSAMKMIHHAKGRQHGLRSSGLYIFDPCIMDSISDSSYMDIKEQLIPMLNNEGNHVWAYKLKESTKKIDSLREYFVLNNQLLNEQIDFGAGGDKKRQLREQVRIGRNVTISSKVYLHGPVLIGDQCTIDDHCQLIGPVTIGNGSHLEKGSLVRESILWQNTHLFPHSSVEHSLVTTDCSISEEETVRNAVVVNTQVSKENINLLRFDPDKDSYLLLRENGHGSSLFFASVLPTFQRKIFRGTKRLLDIAVSLLCLGLLVPVFPYIALAIKRDSLGPIFFRQKRCGLGGREFTMYKFRTMTQNAEQLQRDLQASKNVDGPMFKMDKDPRVTPFGHLLRRSNLDELPQLLNVLRGEMSLVGPRPLVMEEMRFAPSWRDIRLKVKPGITGLWQISGRKTVSFHNWIEQDINYVRQQSLALDIKILLRTLELVRSGISTK